MTLLTIATTQMPCTWDLQHNLDQAEQLVREAAAKGAKVTRAHLEILKNATDADGRKLQVHTVSSPLNPRPSKFSKNNPDFAAGYINYFVINGAVIAPEFGDRAADARVFSLLSELYPDREVVQLNIDAISAGGGGIHCVTRHQPMA